MSIMESNVGEDSEDNSLCENGYIQNSGLAKAFQQIYMEQGNDNTASGSRDMYHLPLIENRNVAECSTNNHGTEENVINIKKESYSHSNDTFDIANPEYSYNNVIFDDNPAIEEGNNEEIPTDIKERHSVGQQLWIENKCAICNKLFNFQRDLIRHAQHFHPNGKALKCGDCNKRFSKIQSLFKHNQKIHQNVNGKYSAKTFVDESNFKHYLNAFTRPLAYSCTLCQKSFKYKRGLNRHQESHLCQKSFTCGLCFKSFARIDCLKRHQRVHTGERPFPCDTCGRAYSDKRYLLKHQKIHSDQPTNDDEEDVVVKPYSCTICFKAFEFECHLNYHIKSHTEERPFSCPLCGRTYKYRKDLNKHLRIHYKRNAEKYNDQNVTNSLNNEGYESREIVEVVQNTDQMMEDPCVSENFEIVEYLDNTIPTNELLPEERLLLNHDDAAESCNLKKMYETDLAFENFTEFPQTSKDNSNINKDQQKSNNKKVNIDANLDQTEPKHFRGLNRYSKTQETGEQRYYPCFLCEKSFTESRLLKQHQKIHLKQKTKNLKKVSKIKKELNSTLVCENNTEIPAFVESNENQYLSQNYEIEENNAIDYRISSEHPQECFQNNINALSITEEINNLENNFYITEVISEDFDSEKCLTNNSNHELISQTQEFLNDKTIEDLSQNNDNLPSTSKACYTDLNNDQDNRDVENKKSAENQLITKIKNQLRMQNKCKICNKMFNFQRDLIKHVQRWHRSVQAFKCRDCNKRYSKIKNLLNHKCIHMKLSKKSTGKRAHFLQNNKSTTLRRHKKSHHENSMKHVCKFCSKSFDLIGQLRSHLKEHNEERPYFCSLCNKSYMYRQGLYRHLSLHTEERPYACSSCEKSFKDKSTLEKHQKMHIIPKNLKPYACTYCYKSFDTETALNLHLKLHTGERPHSCDLCEKTYIRKKDLNKHKRKVHSEEESERDINDFNYTRQEFTTSPLNSIKLDSDVGMEAKTEISLTTDDIESSNEFDQDENYQNVDKKLETESNSKNSYLCEFCSRSFDSIGNYKCHLRSHSEKRPFACTLCDKAYKHKSHLKHHQKIHLDPKQVLKKHVCEICSKSFDLIGRLKDHYRTHSEERPFICSFCERAFKHKSDLNRHLKILHSGENPFTCSLCKISFSGKRSFKKHEKIHLRDKTADCKQTWSLQDETVNLKNTLDIKEEIYSDSEDHSDDMETKNVIEIFKTELIYEDDDVTNAVVKLEDK